MPFKSDDQRKYLFANDPEVAHEFASHMTKKEMKELPKKIKKKDEPTDNEVIIHADGRVSMPFNAAEFDRQFKNRMITILTTNSSEHCWSVNDRPWLEEQPIDFLADQLGLNEGTSEGALKGWDSRRGSAAQDPVQTEKADKRSRVAEWTSSVAERMTRQGDKDADIDHAVASRAHKAAGKAQLAVGAVDKADYHFQKAQGHSDVRKTLRDAKGPIETEHQKAMRAESERRDAIAAGGSGYHRQEDSILSPSTGIKFRG